MKIQNKIAACASFVLTYGMLLSVHAAATLQGLQAGMEGPQFTLKELSGASRTFADLKGEKLTVLVFWSTWSSKSEKILTRMERLHEKYRDRGLSIVGVNVDGLRTTDATLAAIRGVQEKLKIGFPMLVDEGLVSFHDYGVIAVPTTVVLDRERTIAYELSGFPLVGGETMIDFIADAFEERKKDAAPEKPRYRPNKSAVRLYNMGKTTLKSKRMADTAETWFRKAVEADPDFVLPRLSLGGIYLGRGETAKAQEEYRAALAKEPTNPIALCESAMILVNEGKGAEGLAILETAKKSEDSYAPCFYYAAYAIGKMGKIEEAQKGFEEAEKISPQDYLVDLYRGRLFEELKDMRQASDGYRNALRKIVEHH
jgi:Tfp pilus assembly protein PilF/peroxiredoxin